MYYVYIITNLINGKKYIGMSINKKSYFKGWYFGSGKLIKQAIEKYGKENFTKEIVKEFDNEDDTRLFERNLIIERNAVDDPMYYNLAPGGYGGAHKGRKVSPETIEKIKSKLRGKKRGKDVVERIASKIRGRKQSPENIEKRRKSIQNYWDNISDEDWKKFSEINRKNMLGKTSTKETKEKLSKLNARLTKEQVLEIIRIVENKEKTYKEISKIYGINESSICDIVKRKSYKWIWENG